MDSEAIFEPRDEAEIADFLTSRSRADAPVTVRAGGTKASLGRPTAAAVLDLSGLSGIALYEPEELIITAAAGTPIAEIEAALDERGQCLAFEPADLGPLLGIAGRRTLGGTVAAGWSGPRRLKAGAARDHVLGARAIGGSGHAFKSGGRVVKNVTGFDLPKLLTGSHGTLAAMTEITLKVAPAPQTTRTLLLAGLDDDAALRVLAEAMGGSFEISGAAHLPADAASRSSAGCSLWAGGGITGLRLEGFGPSVAARLEALQQRFGGSAATGVLDSEQSVSFWRQVRDVAALVTQDGVIWRLSLPPTEAARTVRSIKAAASRTEAIYDWAGGLVWIRLPIAEDAHVALVRGALPSGHATLVRAPAATRERVPVFQPQPDALAALTRRVKAAFDPAGILGRGRMYPDI